MKKAMEKLGLKRRAEHAAAAPPAQETIPALKCKEAALTALEQAFVSLGETLEAEPSSLLAHREAFVRCTSLGAKHEARSVVAEQSQRSLERALSAAMAPLASRQATRRVLGRNAKLDDSADPQPFATALSAVFARAGTLLSEVLLLASTDGDPLNTNSNLALSRPLSSSSAAAASDSTSTSTSAASTNASTNVSANVSSWEAAVVSSLVGLASGRALEVFRKFRGESFDKAHSRCLSLLHSFHSSNNNGGTAGNGNNGGRESNGRESEREPRGSSHGNEEVKEVKELGGVRGLDALLEEATSLLALCQQFLNFLDSNALVYLGSRHTERRGVILWRFSICAFLFSC